MCYALLNYYHVLHLCIIVIVIVNVKVRILLIPLSSSDDNAQKLMGYLNPRTSVC